MREVRVDDEPVQYGRLPIFARTPLMNHIEFGRDLGSAFTCILENNLMAIIVADDFTLASLPEIYRWLINYAPHGCWGSPEKVSNWKGMRKFESL